MADIPDPNTPPSEAASDSPRQKSSRRQALTPEQRKFLGPGRSWHEREAAKEESAEAPKTVPEPPVTPIAETEPPPPQWTEPAEEVSAPPPKSERRKQQPPSPAVVHDQTTSRKVEMQTVALIIGGLILLGAMFYAGTKVRSVKAFLMSKSKSQVANVDVKKFPGLSAEELVDQALAAERLGKWREAIERYLVAKRRNLLYRGLYFHAGKLAYDHGDYAVADLVLDRARAFGEQPDTALFLRGLIASGRNDLAAAEQFFQAAIEVEPFMPGYYYYLGEVLRRDHRPKDAMIRYQQGANRTINEQDATLCRFKARIAKAETPDKSELETEIEKKRAAGPLSVDWLLTEAALKILSSDLPAATQLIEQARTADEPHLFTLFAQCTSDMLFTEASRNHPEIAAACKVDVAPSAPMATPPGSP